MTVAIVDSGTGNLRSAAKAFERAAHEAGLGVAVEVTSDPDAVRRADRVVLPGDGAFGDCMRGLDALPGMREALDEAVRRQARPFLGICVGMQMLATTGREHGDTAGLGWIEGEVVPIRPRDPSLKVPHMGWNDLRLLRHHPVLAGLETEGDGHAYFVHGYMMRPSDPDVVLATAEYDGPVPAILGSGNLVGTQFHPEKSQALGLRLIANFLAWSP